MQHPTSSQRTFRGSTSRARRVHYVSFALPVPALTASTVRVMDSA